MSGGYMGKMLFVNLSNGELRDEPLTDDLCRDFIGGYGLGARYIFSRQRANIDPLGPENILGFTTGPLSGSPALWGSRYTVVGKSPLTNTWGDANSGGDFGPYLKFAGYDAVFVTGASDKPVYLAVVDGKAELKDAADLWGKDSNETEDILQTQYGKNSRVACIGQSGEKLSLISCVMNDNGRAAGRSGMGAVMGSKRLKAIVVAGNAKVSVANPELARQLRSKFLKEASGPIADQRRKFGTCAGVARAAMSGDSPVKNWGGAGEVHFPNGKAISDVNVIKYEEKKYACWHCPTACGGIMRIKDGPYALEEGHKPEYETLASFGTICLNDNVESIIKANDICNRYGLDTISAGATIAFAIECYENGLISKADTGGIELTWGNHQAIIAMTERLARREGFGDVIADGVKKAAERIGKGAEEFAIHVGGQEIGMHDPKLAPGWATSYVIDATPGRHTQGWERFASRGLEMPPEEKRGERHKIVSNIVHVMNASGVCLFGYMTVSIGLVPEFLNAVTGWDLSIEDCQRIGERIANIRHAFNVREGENPLNRHVSGRFIGTPPIGVGPVGQVTVDLDDRVREYLQTMDWDPATAKPSQKTLLALGLNDVAQALYT